MSEAQGTITIDGQEWAVSDIINASRTGGLADDRVFAELLRMPAYDGTNVYKSILAGGLKIVEGGAGPTPGNGGTVVPAGATGSINVNQFRAIVGSRQTVGTSPTDPTWTGPRANLSDIRTTVFTGSTALAQNIVLTPNSSGNSRWDVVYATVSVDLGAGSVIRRIKSVSSGAVSLVSVPTYLANPVTVGVVTGTPGSSPALPALPADTGGNYNIAIAAVRVPNGFTSASTVSTRDVRDLVGVATLTNGGGQTVASMTAAIGAMTGPAPATGNNDRAGTYVTNFPWSATGGTRPSVFLPPAMNGGHQVIVEVDLSTTGAPSHSSGGIVDDSIDWRNRFIQSVYSGSSTLKFANDTSATSGTSALPVANAALFPQVNQTFVADGAIVSGASTVWSLFGSPMPGGASVGLYVSASDGVLRWFNNGTASNFRFFIWLTASASYPNA